MATDKPRSHHKRPVAENEPPQDAPLTKEGVIDEVQQLAEHARAAGLKPLQTMAETYISQGLVLRDSILSAVGRFLASLENEDSSKKKKA